MNFLIKLQVRECDDCIVTLTTSTKSMMLESFRDGGRVETEREGKKSEEGDNGGHLKKIMLDGERWRKELHRRGSEGSE